MRALQIQYIDYLHHEARECHLHGIVDIFFLAVEFEGGGELDVAAGGGPWDDFETYFCGEEDVGADGGVGEEPP